jgi:hypothetical protein
MKRRNTYRNRTSASADNRPAFFSWSHFAITAIAAVVLAAGLFFAASQHFRSMEFGIKNAKLRSQLAELENEKRRLELSREIALTPSELKRNAKTLGFRDASEFVAVAAKPQPDAPVNAVAEVAKLENDKSDKAVITKAAVADSRPKAETKTAADTRQRTVSPKTPEKPAKLAVDSRPRIVVASAQAPKADPRKIVKKTVMSNPTNRSSENKTVAKLK